MRESVDTLLIVHRMGMSLLFIKRLIVLITLLASLGVAFAHGDLHERIALLDGELAAAPDRIEFWLERADLKRQHQDYPAALRDTDKILTLRPDWPPAFLQRAKVFLDQKDYSAAKYETERCLTVAPTNTDALVIRSSCQVGLGDTNAAVRDLDQVVAIQIRPQPDLFLERARLRAALGQIDAAVKGLDEGLERLGPTPSLALPAFEYARKTGNTTAALNRLETLRQFMRPETWFALQGELLLEAGQPVAASQAFEAGLQAIRKSAIAAQHTPPMELDLAQRLVAGCDRASQAGQPEH